MRETNTLGVYAFRQGGSGDYGLGAAVAVVMVGITLLLTLVHLRTMFRQEEILMRRNRWLWNWVALAVIVVGGLPRVLDGRHLVPGQQRHPLGAPLPADRHARELPGRVRAGELLVVVRQQPAGDAADRGVRPGHGVPGRGGRVAVPVPGPRGLPRRDPARADGAGRGADDLGGQDARRLGPAQLDRGPHHHLRGLRAALHRVDAARLRGGRARELEEAAMVDGSSRLRAFFTVTLPLVAWPGGDGHLRLHPGLERVHVRPRDHGPPRQGDPAGVAAGVQLRRPGHSTGAA